MDIKTFLVNMHLGLNLDDDPRMLQDGELVVADDCDFDTLGSIFSRYWRVANITLSPGTNNIISITRYGGNKIIQTTNSGTPNGIKFWKSQGTAVIATLTGGTGDRFQNKAQYVIYNDVLYISLGMAGYYIKRWDETDFLDAGNPKPTDIATLAAGAAGNLTGDYYYRYTYVDDYGLESTWSDSSAVITVSSKKIAVTVTASASTKVASINIYRIGGTLSEWYFVANTTNTTHAYTDDIADVLLTTLADVEDHDVASSGFHFICEHYERLIAAYTATYPNEVQWSKEFFPEYFGSNLNQQILLGNSSPNDAINGILSKNSILYVFKFNDVYCLEGTDPLKWFKRYNPTIGNLSRDSLSMYKYPVHIWYDGFYMFDGYESYCFSDKIKPYFNILTIFNLAGSVGTVCKDKYYWCNSGVTTPTETIIYDFKKKIFYKHKYPTCAIFYDDLDNSIYTSSLTANIVYKNEQRTNTDSESVSFQIKTKAYQLSEIFGNLGELRDFSLFINTQGENVSFKVYLDGSGTAAQTITLNTASMLRVQDRFNSLTGSFVQFEFTYTGTKRIEIKTPFTINQYQGE